MVWNKLTKFTNILSRKMEKIEVEKNRCLKVRAVISTCSSCVNICPTNSIEIKGDDINIFDSCIHCGLCTTVCETNALKWKSPSLLQLLHQMESLATSESELFIGCTESLKGIVKRNVVKVPCLGIIPTEFWLSLGLNVNNLTIIHQKQKCETCIKVNGEALFLRQVEEAERITERSFTITDKYVEKEDPHFIDHSKRKLLSTLFEEAKETNTLTIKEVLDVEKSMSPFEKFDLVFKKKNEVEEIVETVEEIKDQMVEKLFNEAVVNMDKRAIIFREFEKHQELKEKMSFSIPKIDENCTRCGACVILCPTDALVMHNDEMILSPRKCVSCKLCEEICYEKHISMEDTTGTVFDKNYIFLLK